MDTNRLSDKVAVITGAGRGIGKAIALRFAEEGANLAINDIEPAFAATMADRMKQQGRKVLAVGADVSRWPEVRSMFEQVAQAFGRIDILVNNAGIRKDAPFTDMSEEEFDPVIGTQLKGSFNCARAAQAWMIPQSYGRIINIAAPVPAALKEHDQANYCAANAGLAGLTRSLAKALGAYNITVNGIAPDYIDTEMTRKAARAEGLYLDDLKRFVIAEVPLKRLGTPLEVAHVALFLASDESSFVSGQMIEVKGGP